MGQLSLGLHAVLLPSFGSWLAIHIGSLALYSIGRGTFSNLFYDIATTSHRALFFETHPTSLDWSGPCGKTMSFDTNG